jgi:CRISPR-associated protein Cmr2
MNRHLLALSIGPVQEFIAAARRTRDLWFGSYLLSEISKAAARKVLQEGGSLVLPAPGSEDDLRPDSPLNVANIVLAELTSTCGVEPGALALQARLAAQTRWDGLADRVQKEMGAIIRLDIWREQVADVIEFYAAWMPVDDLTGYAPTRGKVMRLLAGRKNCRNFRQAFGREGVPKSSLDGLRESVLKESGDPAWTREKIRRRLRVRPGEQLDAVGLVKRSALGHVPYPSVSRIAADPWIRGVGESKLAGVFQGFKRMAEQLAQIGALHRLDLSEDRGHPHYELFPFEGTAVFQSRHGELKEEADLTDTDLKPLADALAALSKKAGEPNPYLAIIVADGDRVGEALSQIGTAEQHRRFSKDLSRFAGRARRIVHDHQGILVYSGGDDVLAFAPVDKCLDCARQLHDDFGELLAGWSVLTNKPLTLSVGVAIAHFLEDLEDLLAYGRAAEKHAKEPGDGDRQLKSESGMQTPRDGLAVHLLKRGGTPISVRSGWDDRPDERIQKLALWLLAGAIPSGVAYDLHRTADEYDEWPDDTVADAIKADALHVIASKVARGESALEQVRDLVESRVFDSASLRVFADELLVARQLSVAMRQSRAREEATSP